MMKRLLLTTLAACLAGLARANGYISETHEIPSGWSTLYLEATPTNAACDAVFGALDAIDSVSCYQPDAYRSTAQYDSSGEAINQQPVSHLLWIRGDADNSSLRSVRGGFAYLIHATAACTLAVTGLPQRPHMYWRDTTGDADSALYNLTGPSLDDGTNVSVSAYYGEGPSGAGATVYLTGGAAEASAPTMVAPLNLGKVTLEAGSAVWLSATAERIWPGVIDLNTSADGLVIASNGTGKASCRLTNAGTKRRTIAMTLGSGTDGAAAPSVRYEASDGWTNLTGGATIVLTLDAGDSTELRFASDRTEGATEEGVLSFVDRDGGTHMRVRVPLTVQPLAATETSGTWPQGFYMGSFTLDKVSYGTDPTPVRAGGELKGSLIYRDDGARCMLLQRLCFGSTTNGAVVFALSPAGVRAEAGDESATVRRQSCVVMDPYTPIVTNAGAKACGGTETFRWTVGKFSPVNPMRHSWHPDHDGVVRNSDGTVELAPDGDVPENYLNAVKPELFSITNEVTLADLPTKGDGRAYDETVSGTIVWTLTGLTSSLNAGKIVCSGTYALQRVSSAIRLNTETK